MGNLIDELIDVLGQETEIYNNILKISKDKTAVIVKNKVTELEQIIKLEQSLILQIGKLEDNREDVIKKISEHLNITSKDISVTELLKYINGDQAEQLRIKRDQILSIIDELKVSNEHNSRLIRSSLDYINLSINLLAGVGVESNNYGNTGRVGEPKKRNLFDRKL